MDDACGRMLPVDMQFAMELLSLASAFGFGVDPQVKFGWFYSPPLDRYGSKYQNLYQKFGDEHPLAGNFGVNYIQG